MNVDPAPSLTDLLRGDDDALALFDGDRQVTRAHVRSAARAAADGLYALGLRPGDALAIWLPNGTAWVQLLFAAAELGLLVVPISTRYTSPEAHHLLTLSRARVLIVANRFLDQDCAAIARRLQVQTPTLERVVGVADFGGFFAFDQAPAAVRPARTASPDELLCCFSTSGTTGASKLAAHGKRSITRHACQVARGLDIRSGDAMLCALPLYGVFGFMTLLAGLAGGAVGVLMPVFDAAEAARLIDAERITHAVGSDAMFDAILTQPGARFDRLRRIATADFVGLSRPVTERADRFGVRCSGTYGSSELYSLTALQDWDASAAQRALAGGTPVDPAMQVRVVDPESSEMLADGEAGELQVRGPNVLAGYVHDPEATAKAFSADGWFRTGDLGTAQGRSFTYLARIGDSLRLRGYLVNPAEIESVLLQHPAVSGAQVVGVREVGVGDRAVAFVTRAAAECDEAVLLAWCRARLAAYKAPQRVVAVDEFPIVNGPNGGKIQKRVLREMAAALLARTPGG
jgi:fatty-acyl-CoA synthase